MSHTLPLRSWLAMGVSAGAMIVGAAPAFAQAQGAEAAAGAVGVAPAPPPTSGAVSPSVTGAPAPTTAAPSPDGGVGSTNGAAEVQATGQGRGSSASAAGGPVIEEIVVTAQKREEGIQQVPIAVSAFSNDSLKAQRIEGGPQLQQAIPNVTFAKGNFTGYNFSIRGIGTKSVAASGDGGVAVHENNAPLLSNRLFEAEFYDVERVEVLRGPQGTLYGRNATGGVINVITAKPQLEKFGGSATIEGGNFDTVRGKASINIPVGDTFAIRAAGFFLDRDGFSQNLTNGDKIDGRQLYSGRLSATWKPIEKLKITGVWEHFAENDNRLRTGKQLCAADPGPTSVGGVPTAATAAGALNRGFLSQGCLPASLYSGAGVLGQPNSLATLAGTFGAIAGVQTSNANAGKIQDPNLRNIESYKDPQYRAHNDLYQLDIAYNLTPSLTLSSLTAIDYDYLYSRQDYNRAVPTVPFNANPTLGGIPLRAIAPQYFAGNGVFNDPQVGPSDRLRTDDISAADSYQISQEVRLQSAFKGPVNFSVGGLYLHYKTVNDYYVMSNGLTSAAAAHNAAVALGSPTGIFGFPQQIYIDPNVNPGTDGHNYYLNRTNYALNSYSAFGEVYWQATDDLKITAGLRYTDDEKYQIPYESYLFTPGAGLPSLGRDHISFGEATGRFNIDYRPHLSFTDSTLLYASFSHGYKGGGFNPPSAAGLVGVNPTFAPEFVDAYEIGTKNTLLDGKLILNASAFYYDYAGYQISRIVNRTSANDNYNATIKGLEFESIWEPIRHLRFNAQVGLLDSEIKGDTFLVDTLNRTQGNPALTLVKAQNGSNCVASTAAVATVLAIQQGLPGTPNVAGLTGNPLALLGVCSGAYAALGAVPSDGTAVNLKGNQLPNSPKFTLSVGAQYSIDLPFDWNAVARVDYYRQGEAYARVYNDTADRIHAYDNLNLSVQFNNREMGLNVQAYVKNLMDNTDIVDSYLTDDSSGLFQNVFLTDPRTFGLAVTKTF